jgi:hypothetical protein
VQYLTISIKDYEYYRKELYSIKPYVVICFNDLRIFSVSLGDIMVSSPSHYFFFTENKFNLEYGGIFTELFMHVSSRHMFPTTRNLQIRVHVYRHRYCCGD